MTRKKESKTREFLKDTSTPVPKRNPLWRRIAGVVLALLDLAAVGALLLTGYAGMVSPLTHSDLWGVLPLGFPIALLAVTLLAVLQLFFFRKGLIILAIGFVACLGPFLSYCPLHLFPAKATEGAETFTLLTYNVGNFGTAGSASGDGSGNAALAYILQQDADVVCLQEVEFTPGEQTHITPAQLDSMHARYPYVYVSGIRQAILSKFPVQPIHVDSSREVFGNGDIGIYRITLPSGRLVSIFNVHLFSYSLEPDDKELYESVTRLQKESISDLRTQLLAKLRIAARGRASEVVQLLRWIRLYGGPEAIVVGDFNDVQGCYAIRELAESGFRDAYPEVGFGTMVTFHENRFYFCIDHVLCRGDLRPLWLRKGRTKASDHYPLTVEIEVREQ